MDTNLFRWERVILPCFGPARWVGNCCNQTFDLRWPGNGIFFDANFACDFGIVFDNSSQQSRPSCKCSVARWMLVRSELEMASPFQRAIESHSLVFDAIEWKICARRNIWFGHEFVDEAGTCLMATCAIVKNWICISILGDGHQPMNANLYTHCG